jgi:hypothetical protein
MVYVCSVGAFRLRIDSTYSSPCLLEYLGDVLHEALEMVEFSRLPLRQ